MRRATDQETDVSRGEEATLGQEMAIDPRDKALFGCIGAAILAVIAVWCGVWTFVAAIDALAQWNAR